MESSWGRNIRKYGLGSIGATVAACYLVFPRLVLTNALYWTGKPTLALLPLAEEPDEAYEFFPIDSNIGLHFPYYQPVEPNLPL